MAHPSVYSSPTTRNAFFWWILVVEIFSSLLVSYIWWPVDCADLFNMLICPKLLLKGVLKKLCLSFGLGGKSSESRAAHRVIRKVGGSIPQLLWLDVEVSLSKVQNPYFLPVSRSAPHIPAIRAWMDECERCKDPWVASKQTEKSIYHLYRWVLVQSAT